MIVVIVVLAAVVGSIYFAMRNENMKMKKQWEREQMDSYDSQANMSVP
jgi:flagellar basal body-associated protein FliL